MGVPEEKGRAAAGEGSRTVGEMAPRSKQGLGWGDRRGVARGQPVLLQADHG